MINLSAVFGIAVYKYPLGVKNISSTKVVFELPIIIIDSISISCRGILSKLKKLLDYALNISFLLFFKENINL